MPISLPPLDEHKAIAHFKDHKTKQIDDLITNAVTGKINVRQVPIP